MHKQKRESEKRATKTNKAELGYHRQESADSLKHQDYLLALFGSAFILDSRNFLASKRRREKKSGHQKTVVLKIETEGPVLVGLDFVLVSSSFLGFS